MMPSDFGLKKSIALKQEDCTELLVQTNSQKFIPRIFPALCYYMHLHSLKEYKSEDLKDMRVVLYSDFMPDKNYVVYLDSHMYGMTNCIIVIFFDAQEDMYRHLNKELYNS